MTAVVGRTRAALADAAGEARAGWRGIHTVLLCLFALACAVPWIAPGWVHVDELAAWLYLALSATGLVAAVGLAGLPSLAQGAFMTIGALTTGLLAARAGWPVEATVPVAVLASLVGGLVAGLAVVRLDSLFLAVGTWILTWLVFLGALAFPGISGGSQGYVVDSSLSTTGHYELGLVLTAIAVVAVATLRRSPAGIRLRAVRDRPAAATSLGVRGEPLLLGASVRWCPSSCWRRSSWEARRMPSPGSSASPSSARSRCWRASGRICRRARRPRSSRCSRQSSCWSYSRCGRRGRLCSSGSATGSARPAVASRRVPLTQHP
jgi:hypothetical protein